MLAAMPAGVFAHASFDEMLAAFLADAPSSPSLRPALVVIPSIPFSDHLQLAIAGARGICMGYEFLTPAGFIAGLTGRKRGSFWSKDRLAWGIFPHARDVAERLGIAPASASPRDLFAVSRMLADGLDQYGHFRPEMIRAWAAGESGLPENAGDALRTHEAWQRALWEKLRAETDEEHPAVALPGLRDAPEFLRRAREDFARITVLGSGAVDPLLVEVLGLLRDAGSEVTVHVLLPTLEYLADLKSRPAALAAAREDPEGFSDQAGHPLLSSMGRHAVGTFLLLGRLDEQYAGWPEAGGSGGAEPVTLLARLQSDIRNLREPGGGGSADGSIRVHSCHGARREMEVLRDEILRAFKDIGDLQPSDVHIVVPSLETYAPLVRAVLEQVFQAEENSKDAVLKVRVTELPRAEEDAMIGGVLLLLEMAATGRCEASRLMDLLHLPPVQKALGIADDGRGLERARGWIRDSGLTHDLGESAAAPEIGSWKFARDRIVGGFWHGDMEQARYPDEGGFVLPVENALGSDAELLEKFLRWHACLEDTMREWSAAAVPSAWAERLRLALVNVLGCGDGDDLKARPHFALLRGQDCLETADAGVILDWLDEATGEERRRSVHSGKITFGRFRQLQNIPCRVLAMVGMQDAAFPRRGGAPAWDLLQAAPKIWDRNPRVDDRQLFLDALLAPTDRLIITGSTCNVRTNEDEPFSSCVDELLRVLADMGAAREDIVIRHPLQPFSARYFLDSSRLPRSFSAGNAAVARGIAEAGDRREERPFWASGQEAPADDPPLLEISLHELIAFWKDPARAYIRAQGISLWQEEEDDKTLDFAPVQLDPLEKWKVRNAIVEETILRPDNLDLVKARLAAGRMLPKGELGEQVWGGMEKDAKSLGENIRKNRGDVLPIACDPNWADNPLPDCRIRVTGHVRLTADGSGLLAWQINEAKTARHFLGPWIEAVFAAYVGRPLPTFFFQGKESQPRTLHPALPGNAKNIVRGFLLGLRRPLCYAPETSNAIVAETSRQPSASLEQVLEKAKAKCWDSRNYPTFAPGEGETAAAKLAWRDRDPFAEQGEWRRWAEAIAAPLRAWSGVS